ncbi:AAA family ATPase [Deinococcus lacus]|uniref:AAA family ATPase n=1 Tax=Deinococcus lacus TaxID=392561 RepID=A0ABW1YEZ6_9DEIO
MLKLSVGYPDPEEEVQMLARLQSQHPIEALQPVATPQDLLEAQREVRLLPVSPDIQRYIAQVVAATRQHPAIRAGAGPRASLGVQAVAQALSYLQGHGFVTPDAVKEAARGVLPHRLLLNIEARLAETSAADLTEEILKTVAVPAEGLPVAGQTL